jgi:lipoprotein-anchoring transpeptidase ErfK/SrfK
MSTRSPQPHPHLPRGRVRSLALVVALVLAAASACATSSDAGDGFQLRSEQLQPTTTTTAPLPDHTTETVTANGATLEVFAQKPDATAEPIEPAQETPTATPSGGLAPIPRFDLNSAGVRATFTGWSYDNPTYFGNPLTMVVTERDDQWVKVKVPARPNGQEGWVRASDVTVAAHQFHGELTLSDFTLRMWNGTELIAETQVVIGTDSTPTPVGRLYISEKVPQSYAGGAFGPWVLATSAYSEALDLFDGGLPVIAFHGTNNPGLIGSKASNGCIRMPNDVVTMLAETLPAGTPVDIRA